MPAQPPFLTPTRTPTTGLAAFAITYLMRSAAASVSRITWGLGRELAILAPYHRVFRRIGLHAEENTVSLGPRPAAQAAVRSRALRAAVSRRLRRRKDGGLGDLHGSRRAAKSSAPHLRPPTPPYP